MIRKHFAVGMLLAGLFALIPGTATADDENTCLGLRAKAKGKYEYCVQKWFFQVYRGRPDPQAHLAKCRIKYASTWTKLQGLSGSTTCNQPRFIDNGTTVTDNLTGLEWEKKTTTVGSGPNPTDRHDVDNTYTWSTDELGAAVEDGATFTDFLTDLNTGFAGSNAWRLPTEAELLTILLPQNPPCTTIPCIDSIFGPTALGTNSYWSATSLESPRIDAWVVQDDGYANFHQKELPDDVRAVRGGL